MKQNFIAGERKKKKEQDPTQPQVEKKIDVFKSETMESTGSSTLIALKFDSPVAC